jgi:DNA-binding SARP family transcriptional activator
MGIAVLGPLQVDGQANGFSPRDRVVLSALVVRAGDPMSAEAIADALWGERPPATWTKVIQGCVVRLRKRLGAAAIESGPFGYRLKLNDDELDLRQFERLLERAREALAGGDPARASYLVREALDLWRGRALADLEEWEPGRVEAGRLDGLRMDAEELSVEAEVAAGHASAVLERARALVAQAPFRERRWAMLATALYQSGRQPEALGAIKRARAMLVGELGLDPGLDLVELEQQLLRQDPSLAAPAGRQVSVICPYRGLLPYGAENADSFFGREDDLASCLRRLRDSGVLAVVGPSGIGKSSLVRAGVVASLLRGGTPVLVTAPGTHPMDSLHGVKARGRQTLVVDQAEEAVTVCSDPGERERYFAALAAHVGAGGRLVLSLRADHLGDLAPYPDIARVLEDGLYLLGPMSAPDLRNAIEGPARRAGLRLEPGLVDLLVREVEGEPAALPMLSHVLRETWERREGPTLTVEGYRATGGIRDAVSKSAEALYDGMDVDQRHQLRNLLLRLVTPTEDGDPVRARVPRAKVAANAAHVLLVEQLVDARLVSIDGETVQIAHEALVRVWPRLRGWLDDDVDGQRLFRHLAGAADAWDSMGRPQSELYRGARLSRTLEWRDRATPDLNETEVTFIAESVALSESELRATETRIAHERRVNRRLRGALVGVGVFLVLALVAGVAAVRTADGARQERDRAAASANLADARRASAQAPSHEKVDMGLLLAVAALQVDSSPEAWDNLGAALTRAGPLSLVRDLGEAVGRPGTAWIGTMAASADGALVAASLPVEGVHIFDASTLAPLAFADDTPSSAVAFSPDGTQLAVAVNPWESVGDPGLNAMPVRLYDVPGGAPSERQPGGMPLFSVVGNSLAYSSDGRRLAAVVQQDWGARGRPSRPGGATVWDLADPSEPTFRVAVPEFAVASLSPDGTRLYVAAESTPVRAYDVDSGRLVKSADNAFISSNGVEAVDVSPDGSAFAVASGDRILRLDTATLRPRGPALRGHSSTVTDVSYSHDARLLVSASEDRSAIVWDADSGARLHRFVRGGIQQAAFSADDRTVYTAGADGLVLA